MASAPLVETTRGDARESLHHGVVVVVDGTGRVRYRAGDQHLGLFLRSSAKPLQAIPLVESGGADRFGLSERELAVTCGSHAAEPEHLAAVRSLLSKAGLAEDALQCGAHAPGDSAQAAALVREGRAPTAVHNNCSGKHAGMLAACRARDWPVETYRAPDHPLQQEIAGIVGEFAGIPSSAMVLGTDGCGVPTFGMTVAHVARAFARLADRSGLASQRADAVRRLTGAMTAHPVLVSGTGRFNAALMETLGDRLFAKTGAEGVFGVGLLDAGWGVGVKIEDGNSRGMGTVVCETLRQLELVTPSELASLRTHYRPLVRNHEGRVVGELRPVFTLEKVS